MKRLFVMCVFAATLLATGVAADQQKPSAVQETLKWMNSKLPLELQRDEVATISLVKVSLADGKLTFTQRGVGGQILFYMAWVRTQTVPVLDLNPETIKVETLGEPSDQGRSRKAYKFCLLTCKTNNGKKTVDDTEDQKKPYYTSELVIVFKIEDEQLANEFARALKNLLVQSGAKEGG